MEIERRRAGMGEARNAINFKNPCVHIFVHFTEDTSDSAKLSDKAN